MSAFKPVHLPEDRALNDRGSMTLLRHYALCQRSAFFYQRYKGEAETPEMARGKAGHLAVERSIRAAIEQSEPSIPGELVKVIANEALTEIHVPFEEHDRVREGVWRWSSETAIDPGAVVALETLFALDIDGFQVRCRIDLAELLDGGARAAVRDWKFAVGGVPGYEEIARRRPDGSLAAKNFQLVLYGLALAFGVPVREEDGVEIPEPFPIASRAQQFDLSLVFPLIENKDGKMVTRDVTLTRLELEEYRESLRALVAQLQESERTGDWPAKISDAACSICPARPLCPIPAELRDHRGTINTLDEFAEAMSVLEREKADHRARSTEARNFVKAHGGSLRFGDKVAELVFSEPEEIRDKDAMFEAIERARLYGEPFERSKFVKPKGRNDFKTRDITADELEEAMASGD